MDELPWLFGRAPPWELPDSEHRAELARDLQEDLFTLTRLLHCINAPGSLQCLAGALRSADLWLPEVRAAGGLSADGLQAWQHYTRRVHAALLSRARESDWRSEHEKLLRESIWNICDSNPYYAALVSLANAGEYVAPLSLILTHVWRRLLRSHDILSAHQRVAVGRALRALYDDHGPRPFLELSRQCSDRDLAQVLADAEVGVDSTGRAQLQLLQRLLRGTLAEGEGQGGGGGGHGGGPLRGRRRLQDRVTLDEVGIDPDRPPEETAFRHDYRVERRSFRPDGREFETEPVGMAPADRGTSETYASVPADATVDVERRLDKLAKRVDARAIANDVAMRAQSLPHRWELLTPGELAILFAGIDALANDPAPDGSQKGTGVPPAIRRALAVLLLTMLVRGMDAEEVARIRLEVRDATAGPGEARSGHWLCVTDRGRSGRSWHWEGPATLVAGGVVANTALVRETTDRLCLRLDPPLSALFDAVLRDVCLSLAPGESVPLIPQPKPVLKELKAWCSRTNRAHGCRLTAHRIARYLPWRAGCLHDLDPVMVAYVRGKSDLASATQAYYQLCDSEVLQTTLAVFWKDVVASVVAETADRTPAWLAGRWPQRELDLYGAGLPGVGSKKVPTRAAVCRVVDHVQRKVTTCPAAKIPPWDFVTRYHNVYTLYTVHYCLWATGARAVTEPLPDLRYVDPASGLILLCDKSPDDRYGARLVWTSPDFLEQLEHYRAHLAVVAERVGIYRPDLSRAHAATMAHWQGTAEPIGQPKGSGLKSLFWEFVDGRLEVLTPELATGARMPRKLALPANANRHYIRTYLCERHCRHDLIDAQLGHWHHGREPWGASSSLSPPAFAATMRRFLGPLTAELGFRPLPSALVKAR